MTDEHPYDRMLRMRSSFHAAVKQFLGDDIEKEDVDYNGDFSKNFVFQTKDIEVELIVYTGTGGDEWHKGDAIYNGLIVFNIPDYDNPLLELEEDINESNQEESLEKLFYVITKVKKEKMRKDRNEHI